MPATAAGRTEAMVSIWGRPCLILGRQTPRSSSTGSPPRIHSACHNGHRWCTVMQPAVSGMSGYHHFEGMPWIDAVANAAMILSGMGPLATLTTAKGKLFAGFYALFSGLAFIVVMGIVFAPVVHRFMHRFHLEKDKKDS